MNKFESKYYDTAVRMDEAFLDLLETKDYEYITVKEICQKAGVNRSTFYLHYESVNDLLMESAEYISDKMAHYFDGREQIKDVSMMDVKDLNFITPENLKPWLTSVKDNRRLFQTVLKKSHMIGMDRYQDALRKNILEPAIQKHGFAKEDTEYILYYYLEGIFAIVKVWLRDDCKREIDDIVKLIITCVT